MNILLRAVDQRDVTTGSRRVVRPEWDRDHCADWMSETQCRPQVGNWFRQRGKGRSTRPICLPGGHAPHGCNEEFPGYLKGKRAQELCACVHAKSSTCPTPPNNHMGLWAFSTGSQWNAKSVAPRAIKERPSLEILSQAINYSPHPIPGSQSLLWLTEKTFPLWRMPPGELEFPREA